MTKAESQPTIRGKSDSVPDVTLLWQNRERLSTPGGKALWEFLSLLRAELSPVNRSYRWSFLLILEQAWGQWKAGGKRWLRLSLSEPPAAVPVTTSAGHHSALTLQLRGLKVFTLRTNEGKASCPVGKCVIPVNFPFFFCLDWTSGSPNLYCTLFQPDKLRGKTLLLLPTQLLKRKAE